MNGNISFEDHQSTTWCHKFLLRTLVKYVYVKSQRIVIHNKNFVLFCFLNGIACHKETSV